MKAFKKILFPIDFSDVSPKIVPWVRMVAEKFDAEIHLLFVVRQLQYFSSFHVAPVAIEKFEEQIVKGAEAKLDEFLKTHFREYPACKAKVMLGDIAEEILNYTESERIDLVIIGTHGRKIVDRVFFGSVADRVIKMAQVPVLSINPYRVSAFK